MFHTRLQYGQTENILHIASDKKGNALKFVTAASTNPLLLTTKSLAACSVSGNTIGGPY